MWLEDGDRRAAWRSVRLDGSAVTGGQLPTGRAFRKSVALPNGHILVDNDARDGPSITVGDPSRSGAWLVSWRSSLNPGEHWSACPLPARAGLGGAAAWADGRPGCLSIVPRARDGGWGDGPEEIAQADARRIVEAHPRPGRPEVALLVRRAAVPGDPAENCTEIWVASVHPTRYRCVWSRTVAVTEAGGPTDPTLPMWLRWTPSGRDISFVKGEDMILVRVDP